MYLLNQQKKSIYLLSQHIIIKGFKMLKKSKINNVNIVLNQVYSVPNPLPQQKTPQNTPSTQNNPKINKIKTTTL